MKAIRTRYVRRTDRMPARWVAEDGDRNRAFVTATSHTAADAVEALCQRMGWAGELVAGGFGGVRNEEFWVWTESGSPRITVGAPVAQDGLDDEQRAFIIDFGTVAPMTADAVRRHWSKGEHYYIDERVRVPRLLRARFNAINDKLLAAADARFEQGRKGVADA